MVTFKEGSSRFTYRVGAVVLRQGHVLLMRSVGEDVWFVPGGRVELGETAKDAVAREVVEEIGARGVVERLIWINENFFRLADTDHHELALYFLVSLPEPAHDDLSEESCCEEPGGARFELAWHRLDALHTIRIVPGFLTDRLASIPDAIEHVVHVDS
jgi:ADP-ribose pyrophosphatase YjhB (NUDIX family)